MGAQSGRSGGQAAAHYRQVLLMGVCAREELPVCSRMIADRLYTY